MKLSEVTCGMDGTLLADGKFSYIVYCLCDRGQADGVPFLPGKRKVSSGIG